MKAIRQELPPSEPDLTAKANTEHQESETDLVFSVAIPGGEAVFNIPSTGDLIEAETETTLTRQSWVLLRNTCQSYPNEPEFPPLNKIPAKVWRKLTLALTDLQEQYQQAAREEGHKESNGRFTLALSLCEAEFREPTGADIEKLEIAKNQGAGNFSATTKMAAILCTKFEGRTSAAAPQFYKLLLPDFFRLDELMQFFLR